MALFLRTMVLSLAALSVVYFCLLFFLQARKREALEEAYLAAGQPGDRATRVDEPLEQYMATLRRKLVWGVYVAPLCVMAAIVVVTTNSG